MKTVSGGTLRPWELRGWRTEGLELTLEQKQAADQPTQHCRKRARTANPLCYPYPITLLL